MTSPVEPTILVIFGGMGDLTWRKLAPALYNLMLDKSLPDRFAVIGLDIKEGSTNGFRQRLRDGLDGFCECGEIEGKIWEELAGNLTYISGDFASPVTYATLSKQLKAQEKEWKVPANHIFYLATPPTIVETNGFPPTGGG